MKKRLLSTLLCLALLLGMAPSVMATTEGAMEISVLKEYPGKKVNIPSGWEIPTDMGAAFPSGNQISFLYARQSIFFGDTQSKYAMVNLKNTASGEYKAAYIDRKGNVEFFTPLSAESITKAPGFYDGIGAAVKRGGENNHKLYVSYYTQDGAVIADYNKEYRAIFNPHSTGHVIVSEFVDGFAYVFKDVSDGYFYNPEGDEWDKLAYETKEISASYAKINTKGELISDWSEKQVIIPAEAWKGERGVSYDNYLQHPSAIKFHFTRAMKSVNYGPNANGSPRLTYPVAADQVIIMTANEFRIVDVSAFGGEAEPTTPLKSIPDLHIFDQGLNRPLGYTVTNNTGKPVDAYYALLSYWPTTSYYPPTEMYPQESEYFHGQILPLDLKLAPREKISGDCWATAVGWSTMTHLWIQFDSKEERDSFYSNKALTKFMDSQYEIDNQALGIQWMKDVMGIVIKSGKK